MNSQVSVEDNNSECSIDELLFAATNLSMDGEESADCSEKPIFEDENPKGDETGGEDVVFYLDGSQDMDKLQSDCVERLESFSIEIDGITVEDNLDNISDDFSCNTSIAMQLFNTDSGDEFEGFSGVDSYDFEGFPPQSPHFEKSFDGFLPITPPIIDVKVKRNQKSRNIEIIPNTLSCTDTNAGSITNIKSSRKRKYEKRNSISYIDIENPSKKIKKEETVELPKCKGPFSFEGFRNCRCSRESSICVSTSDHFLKENINNHTPKLNNGQDPVNDLFKEHKNNPTPKLKNEQDPVDDFIGIHCAKVGCTITWLESGMPLEKPAKITNGIVYELSEFAKKIAWEPQYVAEWILRLRSYEDGTPSDTDLKKIYLILKRRKALSITLSGKNLLKQKLQSFDSGNFSLPSSELLDNKKISPRSPTFHSCDQEIKLNIFDDKTVIETNNIALTSKNKVHTICEPKSNKLHEPIISKSYKPTKSILHKMKANDVLNSMDNTCKMKSNKVCKSMESTLHVSNISKLPHTMDSIINKPLPKASNICKHENSNLPKSKDSKLCKPKKTEDQYKSRSPRKTSPIIQNEVIIVDLNKSNVSSGNKSEQGKLNKSCSLRKSSDRKSIDGTLHFNLSSIRKLPEPHHHTKPKSSYKQEKSNLRKVRISRLCNPRKTKSLHLIPRKSSTANSNEVNINDSSKAKTPRKTSTANSNEVNINDSSKAKTPRKTSTPNSKTLGKTSTPNSKTPRKTSSPNSNKVDIYDSSRAKTEQSSPNMAGSLRKSLVHTITTDFTQSLKQLNTTVPMHEKEKPSATNSAEIVRQPVFDIGDNVIGDHCDANKIDIKMLNSTKKMSCPLITNGMVYELYYFFKERKANLTSLVNTLFRLKGEKPTKPMLIAAMAKLHQVVKALWEQNYMNNLDMPFDEFHLHQPAVSSFQNQKLRPLVYNASFDMEDDSSTSMQDYTFNELEEDSLVENDVGTEKNMKPELSISAEIVRTVSNIPIGKTAGDSMREERHISTMKGKTCIDVVSHVLDGRIIPKMGDNLINSDENKGIDKKRTENKFVDKKGMINNVDHSEVDTTSNVSRTEYNKELITSSPIIDRETTTSKLIVNPITDDKIFVGAKDYYKTDSTLSVELLSKPETLSVAQLSKPEALSVEQLSKPEAISVEQPSKPEVISIEQPSKPEALSIEQPSKPEALSIEQLSKPEVTEDNKQNDEKPAIQSKVLKTNEENNSLLDTHPVIDDKDKITELHKKSQSRNENSDALKKEINGIQCSTHKMTKRQQCNKKTKGKKTGTAETTPENFKKEKITEAVFDLNSTKGSPGKITRGDIVYLYTRWLKKKMEGKESVFVTDLSKDVEILKNERKVFDIRIPVGTLMSSSVKLFEEFRALAKISMTQARDYLLANWMEDLDCLINSKTGVRNYTPKATESVTASHKKIKNNATGQSAKSIESSNIQTDITSGSPDSQKITSGSPDSQKITSGSPDSQKIHCSQEKNDDEAVDTLHIIADNDVNKKVPLITSKHPSPIIKLINQNVQIAKAPTGAVNIAPAPKKVKKIIGYRIVEVDGKSIKEYRVKYMDLPASSDSWIEEQSLGDDLLNAFWDALKKQRDKKEVAILGEKNTEQKKLPDVKKNEPKSIAEYFNMNFIDSLDTNLVNYQLEIEKELPRRVKVSKAEVLNIYDNWRTNNKKNLHNGNVANLNISNLIDSVRTLMEDKKVRNFNSDCIIDACFRISLMRSKLRNEKILDKYLESDFTELMKASGKHQSWLREEYMEGKTDIKAEEDSSSVPDLINSLEIGNLDLALIIDRVNNEPQLKRNIDDCLANQTENPLEKLNLMDHSSSVYRDLSNLGVSKDCIDNIIQLQM